MPWLFLFVTLVGAWLTYNAYRPREGPMRRAFLSFFPSWLTGELALHHIAWQVLATFLFILAGALAAWPGKLGLAIALVSWAALGAYYARSREAAPAVERALREALGSDYREKIAPELSAKFARAVDWRPIVRPVPIRHPEVETVRDIVYTRARGLNIRLDLYRHREKPSRCPTLLEIHGGAWVIGNRKHQGLPLMYHMASRGWVCVSADYRLSPHATFPEQLVDLKRAIRWIREEGPGYGVDPDFIVVMGQSAGAHLAALVALTANEAEYQPGFEEVDTSVRGCVAFYGIYDFMDRHGIFAHRGLAKLLEQQIMKASIEEDREAYRKASPIDLVGPGSPPFLVVHGDRDSLAPVEGARRFCEIFRQNGHGPVAYAEIPGAQHAFELFPSLRATLVVQGVERFLAYLYSQYPARKTSEESGLVQGL